MRLLHISDLHLGKRVKGFSMIDDQVFILNQIVDIIDSSKVDGVIIAGDVYDKTEPPTEAVCAFDDFIYSISKRNISLFISGGNHDAVKKLSFGSRVFSNNNIFISPSYKGNITPVSVKEKGHNIDIYMLPFLNPSTVRTVFPEKEIATYDDAVRVAVEDISIDTNSVNILIGHQFVTNSAKAGSEVTIVGGLDNISAGIFSGFDYVALGHIHRRQQIGDNIFYCGSPLQYSVDEAGQKKSVTVVDIGADKTVTAKEIELVPKRKIVKLEGTYNELMEKDFYDKLNSKEDYFYIVLKDEQDIPDVLNRMRIVYPNIMEFKYDNRRTRYNANVNDGAVDEDKTPMEFFEELFEQQNNGKMNDGQREYCAKIIEEIWGAN